MNVKPLTWQQVNTWRLSQQYLSPRLPHRNFVEAAIRTCGIQAQVMSAAELAFWARTDGLTPADIESALWRERTLIKTWAMRGTLHLLAASDLPLYVAARSYLDNRNWPAYFAYFGFTSAQYEAFVAAVSEVLGDQPMTRQQLASALAEHTSEPKLGELIMSSGWGSPLKPAAFRGDLCFGPSNGQNVTFVNPSKWVGTRESIDPEQAIREIIRRYLQVYGPAKPQDFSLWWWGGAGASIAKKLFKALEDELETVDVEGWQGYALRATLEPMNNLEPTRSIRLLPLFDAYTLALGRDIEALLPKVYKKRVYRPQGWISAVILVDGFIKGIWEYKTKRNQTTIKVDLFSTPTAAIKRGIKAEVKRLGDFLNTRTVLEA
jgi:hypothetical protein